MKNGVRRGKGVDVGLKALSLKNNGSQGLGTLGRGRRLRAPVVAEGEREKTYVDWRGYQGIKTFGGMP